MTEDEEAPTRTFVHGRAVEPIMQHFDVPDAIAQPFRKTAEWLLQEVPKNGQRSIALQHLLDAMTAAVRARAEAD